MITVNLSSMVINVAIVRQIVVSIRNFSGFINPAFFYYDFYKNTLSFVNTNGLV